MTIEQFWALVEDSRVQGNGDIQHQKEHLLKALVNLSEGELLAFNEILWNAIGSAYRADLWEAISVIACACGDEDFLDFRGWLVAQGQATFESVLEDPDNLANVVSKKDRLNLADGDIPYIGVDSYELKMGFPMDDPYYHETSKFVGKMSEESERPAKFPRIIAAIGECDGTEWLS